MLIVPYQEDQLRYAYAYQVYLRWRTHRAVSRPPLSQLDVATVSDLVSRFEIHVLECASDETDVLLLVSLRPEETVSACASKLKGQVSNWLRERLKLSQPADLLSKGYFAFTAGKSTAEAVEKYLDEQGEHHGYSDRPRPPFFVRTYEPTVADQARLQPKHAATQLQFHIVLATWHRRGTFGATEAEAVADRWHELQSDELFVMRKVSFVPDHVHIALHAHPTVSPAKLIVQLMNAAQSLMFDRFPNTVIQAGVERLWQPSAYLGSYGNLATPQIRQYMENWEVQIRND